MRGLERLLRLVDEGSFEDIDRYDTTKVEECDGVYAGTAEIKGISSCVIVQEQDYLAGTMGEMHIDRMARVARESLRKGIPLLCVYSSGGARFQERTKTLYMVSELVKVLAEVRMKVPYFSAILGPCAGGASISASLSDLIVMRKENSSLFVYGPLVTKEEFGLSVGADDMGGAMVQAKNLTASIICESEEECIENLKRLLLISMGKEDGLDGAPLLGEKVLKEVGVKKGVELFPLVGENVKAYLTLYKHRPLVVLTVKGKENLGYIGYKDTLKIYRILELCNRRSIAVLEIIDSPGFAPLPSEEAAGLVSLTGRIADLLSKRKFKCACLIQQRCFGGLFVLLCSKGLGCDFSLAYEDSIISFAPKTAYYAVVGKEGKFESKFSASIAEREGFVTLIKKNSDLRKYLSRLVR